MIKHLYLAAILMAFSSFGQDGPKVVVFNAPEDREETQFPEFNNILKISVFEAFSGDIPIYYERVLTGNVTAEIGIGVTTDDYSSILFEDFFDDYSSYSGRKAQLGYSFGAGVRYYPFRATEEFYFAPEFKYRLYNSTYVVDPMNPQYSEDYQKSVTNFRITAGYTEYLDDRIVVDFFVGLGIAVVKRDEAVLVYDEQGNPFYQTQSITTPKPRVTLGIKFGFAF